MTGECLSGRSDRPKMIEVVRYSVTVVPSLALDLSVVWLLTHTVGLPMLPAVGLGFVAGGSFNYVVHELWTFHSSARAMSLNRWASYLAAVSSVLGLRILFLYVMDAAAGGQAGSDMQRLLVASGLSFVANYFVSKYLIFRSPRL